MRGAGVAAVAVLLSGCGGTTAATHPASPAAVVTVSASPAGSPGTPAATPTPAPADLPLTRVSFTCRLPVLMVPQEGSYQGAFIAFPAATMATDPSGLITSDVSSSVLMTGQAPVLSGDLGFRTGLPFYDAAERRWLPVGAGQASPDGSQYAYVAGSGSASSKVMRVHVVEVASATDKSFSFTPPVPGATSAQVADFDGKGVYLVYSTAAGQGYSGVWRLDVATGRVTPLADVPDVEIVRAGIAWIGLNDPRDPNPPGGGQSFDTLIALNLATGTRTVWEYQPGHIVSPVSVDGSGRPTVAVLGPPDYVDGTLERLTAPGTADFVHQDLDHWFVQPDGDRLWLGNDRGVYLFTPSAGLQKVLALPPNDGIASGGLAPAGVCR